MISNTSTIIRRSCKGVRLLAPLLLLVMVWASEAGALTISITDPDVTASETADGFTVTLAPNTHSALSAGATSAFRALIPGQTDGDVQTVAGSTIAGTLSVSILDATAGGGSGGLDIVAVATGLPALGVGQQYRWIQFIETNVPADGAVSPYVDPQPNDDPAGSQLPFYWTNTERTTGGTGETAGGDIRFEDSPSRALEDGTTWRGNLYLVNYEATGGPNGTKKITIYDGLKYGFNIEQSVPEPGAGLLTAMGLLLLTTAGRKPVA